MKQSETNVMTFNLDIDVNHSSDSDGNTTLDIAVDGEHFSSYEEALGGLSKVLQNIEKVAEAANRKDEEERQEDDIFTTKIINKKEG